MPTDDNSWYFDNFPEKFTAEDQRRALDLLKEEREHEKDIKN